MRTVKTFVLTAALSGRALTQGNGTFIPSAPVIFPLSSDSEFSYQLQQTIAMSDGYPRGANPGEVLRAASQITPSDFESYYQEFSWLGNTIQDYADSLNTTKYPDAARDAYFRASTYLRSSLFFLTGNSSDERLYTVWDQAIDDFDKGNALMEYPGVRYNVSAPLDARANFSAPMIFYKSDNSTTKRPTVLWGNGYDGPMEDGLHMLGRWVLERGWNFAVYEGPGQNTPRRQQNIGFQPDWWNVVTPLVSFLGNRSDVDSDRIALIGVSYGGLLAPRSATHEHRLAAVLSIDADYSVTDSLLSQVPSQLVTLYNTNTTAFDAELNLLRNNASTLTAFRWAVNQGLWSFDTTSPSQFLDMGKAINLTQSDVDLIPMPYFIGLGQNDTSFPGQAATVQQWFSADNKSFSYNFTNALGAGQHCQVGAESQLAAISLNWLQDVFANVSSSSNGTVVQSTTNGGGAVNAGMGMLFITGVAAMLTML